MATEYPERFNPGGLQNTPVGATLASATTMTGVTHKVHPVSGTTTITLMNVPWEGFKGIVWIIPASTAAVATGGTETTLNKPFATAYTFVANRPVAMLCDGAFWYVMAVA